MKHIDTKTLAELKAHRGQLTRQQFLTLRGQALAGDPNGAMQGLRNILRRVEELKE